MHSNQSNNLDNRPVYLDIFNAKVEEIDKNKEKMFLNNLYKIGYSKIFGARLSSKKGNLVKAFQRRYRQSLINGKIDKECLFISQNLIEN